MKECSKIFVSLPFLFILWPKSKRSLFWFKKKNMRFFTSLRMTMWIFGTASVKIERVFQNFVNLPYPCHPEAEGSLFWLEKKGRDSSLRSEWRFGFLEQSQEKLRVFQNSSKFTFPCHSEAVRSKDLVFWFFDLKRKLRDSSYGCRMTVWIFRIVSLLACFMLKFKSKE
jgi:hypothetical protein